MTRERTPQRGNNRLVAGEDPHVLRPLLMRLAKSMTRNGDDTVSLQADYSRKEGPPLARALMRVEAELLIEDARRLRTPDDACRTPERRSADALVLLLLRTVAALGHPVDAGQLKRITTGSHLRTP